MKMNRRQAMAITGAALTAGSLPSFAQDSYPKKAIRIVLPWVAGTPGDTALRAVVERMSVDLKQPIYIDNKSGATGTAAMPEVLRAPADGYTLFHMNSSSLVAPLLYPAANIDYVRDFVGIGPFSSIFSVLATSTAQPFKTVPELVAAAKAKPGALTYASAGNGSPPHLVGELFKQAAGVDILHVPYAQVSQALADLTTGRVDMMFMGAPLAVPQVTGGRLRAVAVTSAQRLPWIPEIPTFVEAGYKDVVFRQFDGLLARKGTPQGVVGILGASLQKALATPMVQEVFHKNSIEVFSQSSQDFEKYLAVESVRWLSFGKRIGISAA
ncbi:MULTISPECIES: Bug family tripartite tricarboxylate transporter substrate binding protein [Variovorax]|uniref:Bug family tripartite tricarboxylate transporter substrate binding protein n=1 Tax=Variovorax TaxID=34072 RepID=UPI0009287FEF|nr:MULTISPECIES: tripartite tricarboxylate transporter substrate binding protein [Variovorax]MBN8751805.1 tripartite tricarboxylate transporter substrate binding protein [Variovorax sp.]OJZ12729.1 MAG: hypothetical protein BGP22_22465 [Variovorax sp. 67-131]UKI07787.1 tripartite tricarboxylate transporter substrate binding protein [Variovorax paradoxus]